MLNRRNLAIFDFFSMKEFLDSQTEKLRKEAFESPETKFLLLNLLQNGCKFEKGNLDLQKLPLNVVSKLAINSQNVKISINNLIHLKQNDINTALRHELLVLYDYCRAQTDFKDPKHRACSILRATNLSGECSFKNEKRRNYEVGSDKRNGCIKRRAVKTLMLQNFGSEESKKLVEEVWVPCFYDTTPYPQRPVNSK
ncbi:Mitochondrial inner membrane protease ATP23 [Bonamia ostreae]|uniref:Mitochondrial inner membrane protease ATP23 n=1 Tax=Bonamia ostreae TaxID=126728 RepID=A0ABV2AR19_9EUKA